MKPALTHATLFVGFALLAPQSGGLAERFKQLDRNGDGKVYWNTGLHGGKENHWLRLRFSGVTDAALIGARVEVTASGMKQYRWIHSNHSYKSGGALEAHFGLGRHERADATVILISGRRYDFPDLKAGRYLDVNLSTRTVSEVHPR